MSVQFGIWNFDGEAPVPPSLEKVETFLARYAPDGVTCHSTDGVRTIHGAFRTTRESHRERQPYICASGVVITWDGRLDNRSELVDRIPDATLTDSADVGIFAAAYERWGCGCFAKLTGDWAVAVWNPTDRSLLLGRDPVGTRPLYYSIASKRALWCTLLEPVVLFSEKILEFDEEYLAGCLGFFPAAHLTPYAGIHSVPPSTFVRIRNGTETTHRYWDFDPASRIRYRDDRDYEEQFLTLFREAVRRRLHSAHPVLAELSGGMDSSSVVSMADRLIASGAAEVPRLDTVSYYDDSEPNWNERPYFTKVEERRGRSGLHIDVGAESFTGEASGWGPPRVSPASEGKPSRVRQLLNQSLSTHGYRVLLSGFGGDEVLGGVPDPNSELADLLSQARLGALARQLKSWALAKREPWVHLLGKAALRFFPPLAGVPDHLRPARWINPRFARRYRAALGGYERRIRFFGASPTFQENLATIETLRRQLGFNVPPCEPTYEKRYPYLDRHLLEFLFAIPREQLVRPGQRRSLMRRALARIVPEEILHRRRKAFLARRPLLWVAEQWRLLLQGHDRVLLAALGIIEPRELEAEIGRARAGRGVSPVTLMHAVGIEVWLRSLERSGLLRIEKGSQERVQIAATKFFSRSTQRDLSAERESTQEGGDSHEISKARSRTLGRRDPHDRE